MHRLGPKIVALGSTFVLVAALALSPWAAETAEAHVSAKWQRKAAQVAYRYWKKQRPKRAICHPAQVKIKQTQGKPNGHWAFAPLDVCAKSDRKPWIKVWHKAGKYGWTTYCSLIVHEWGHLIGLKHSKKKTDVMHPVVGPKNFVKLCGRAP